MMSHMVVKNVAKAATEFLALTAPNQSIPS